MSFNGSGVFSINTSGQPVVTGTVISSTAFNAFTADIATGLSTCVLKDGTQATTARVPFAFGIESSLTTDSTSVGTGSIFTAGGVGITKALFVGGLAAFGSGAWPTVTLAAAAGQLAITSSIGTGYLIAADTQAGVGTSRGGEIRVGARGTTATLDMAYAYVRGQRTNASSGNLLTNLVLGVNDASGNRVEGLLISGAGEVTKPLQPAFLAINSATDTDVTGDGTTYTVICNTEVYDQGGDYDNTTGIFTAPVTGRYLFTMTIGLDGLAVGHSNISIVLIASNRTMTFSRIGTVQTGGALSVNGATFVDMDAADTAILSLTVDGTPKSVDVLQTVTAFAGALFA